MTPDLRQQTIDTYNKSAKELAEYFKGIGPRNEDIDRAFDLAGEPQSARVLEIGCGDGRDAKQIEKRAKWYLGFDISEELIKLAKDFVPTAKFEVGDANTFDYPKDLDVVFAFASLLHLDKDQMKSVLAKIHESLKPNGILYMSLKYSPHYVEKIKEDKYGVRQFFFYSSEVVKSLTGNLYKMVFEQQHTIKEQEWLEIALRKL